MPELVRSFVEIRHRQIRRHGPPVARTPPPDRCVRKQPPIAPAVSFLQLIRRHVSGPEDHVRCIVKIPVAMNQPALRCHLPKERRPRIGREDMKRRAFQAFASTHCVVRSKTMKRDRGRTPARSSNSPERGTQKPGRTPEKITFSQTSPPHVPASHHLGGGRDRSRPTSQLRPDQLLPSRPVDVDRRVLKRPVKNEPG